VFGQSCFSRETTAFQVERSIFDHLLLKHAQASGAEVKEGWTVRKFTRETDQIVVEATNPAGERRSLRAAFLVDASGRGNFTGNQEGLRVVHPHHKKIAVFAQFENVALDSGPTADDIVIVRLANKWFWIIPLSKTKVSVGCVLDQTEFVKAKQVPADLFERVWRSSAEMRSRMNGARLLNAIQTTSDFSYYNRKLASPRLLRVGDAAGFMDPIFSAGVYMAMHSGKLAAQVVLDSLSAGDDGGHRLRRYEKSVFRVLKFYWKMVDGFYTKPFMEIFLTPNSKYQLPDAIIANLAGEFEGGWPIRWRRQVFFWLTALQARWPLTPRISFAENEPASAGSLQSSSE
jgi:FADH2-dependent halogenase